MTSSQSERFRSATEFPKTLDRLAPAEAEQIYVEMRDCLVFTNRSRAQLTRRNEEHKQKVQLVKADVERLQAMIQQLGAEKQQMARSNQQTVSELTEQVELMSTHFDQLTAAFDGIADIENPAGFMAQPSRFFRFIQALKAVILFWRDESNSPALPNYSVSQPAVTEAERRENPQMHSDQASQGRSLLDQ
ncbi:MAG: hypothetical protein KME07_12465 [Pegethrix bostrychoides GSE-TBD4-15B]|jgi:hypothetical protein|uniref:Uncharacterized protein n=1 Tax=Pegethrix bostrychoides GSE-TBD4-15B TaxID=2839662 RepID=A0A951PBX7_9CYAN|nr:hypothetical protein [Pegethrix bostrychoides GSE-TBD4-15B]